ncbi:MAG: nucleotidyltransferase family protein [Erysipelotrichaceae bacterium]|nr:nucleotidyltransferase family protein [Erysipelotrichaceae bacterium]
MKIAGIIAEYNPLHNGHILHIEKTKQLTNCDLLIAVISGNFNQRGTISIIDKQTKIQSALKHGVDLVLEIPTTSVLSNADIFAKGAIDTLKLCDIDYLVFGSETNNLKELKEIAHLNINVNHLKENLKAGLSFPQSYGLLSGKFEANDILAISYLKELKNSPITPLSIKRHISYHSDEINDISSASAIRKAVKNNIDYHITTPLNITKPQFNEKYFSYLQTLLTTANSQELKEIYLIDEGIENHLIKCIANSDNYDDFINKAITRRYTKARIERSLIHIMMNNKKTAVKNLPEINFIRVLGFNKKGQNYLKKLKTKTNVAVNFNQIPKEYRELFYKAALLYAHNLDKDHRKNILDQEIKGPIIIK